MLLFGSKKIFILLEIHYPASTEVYQHWIGTFLESGIIDKSNTSKKMCSHYLISVKSGLGFFTFLA